MERGEIEVQYARWSGTTNRFTQNELLHSQVLLVSFRERVSMEWIRIFEGHSRVEMSRVLSPVYNAAILAAAAEAAA